MIRSMYSAISGLRNHQTMMDVVGNNISNVNTNGFKNSSTQFEDVLSQTLKGANGPALTGGTNPAQVGLGSALSAINTDFSQGSLQRSGRETDFAIQGDGFFVVEQGGQQLYTRAGSLSLDASGELVTSDGARLQGWQADQFGAVNSNGPLTAISIPVGSLVPPNQTGNIQMQGNLPSNAVIGDTVATAITVHDTQGSPTLLNFLYTKTAANEWTATASYGTPATNVPIANNVMTFDAFGQRTSGASMTIAAGAVPQTGAVNVNLGLPADPNHVTQFGATSSMLASGQDGSAPGVLQDFTMGRDGMITATYSNGLTRSVGQVALATFTNPQGLDKLGGSDFRASANSGTPQIGVGGTGGRGVLVQAALEQSNVDLAQEFTNLIMAQRGFQANSRVITTSDEMLQEVVNLKR